jgi:hypothetical protein
MLFKIWFFLLHKGKCMVIDITGSHSVLDE